MRHHFLFLFLSIFSFQLSAQCIAGDCQNGQGTYVYPSGAKYIGAFKDGEIHGVGVCYYTDGGKYSGQWMHRYPEGKGTKTYADGTKRHGDWLKGQAIDEQGEIIELVAKGETEDDGTDIQTGCISGDCENGTGVFAYADGTRYEGQFVNGKLAGFGSLFKASGEKFVGSFENNFQNGSGTMFHTDGTKSIGQWMDGEYFGDTFREMGVDGCQQGDCENGEGIYIYKDGAAKYVGQFKDGLADGLGTCYYANGERYEGDWLSGSFEGMGTLYMLDGTQVEGYWKEGTYMSKELPEDLAIAKIEKVEAVETVDKLAVKEAMTMKVWAVIIGVADYSHMPALKYTDDDAYRVFSFLKSPAGGALKDEQIRILIDENATKEKIITALTDVFGKAGENDLVMMYYSGHGLKGSFLPIDFDGFNNKLGHDEVNRILKSSKAKYKICIADACHSGSLLAMKSGTVSSMLNTYYTSLAQAEPGTALIMSSKSEETSLESSGLRQGVFSHFLQRGMKGEADADANKIVTISELYEYISENVRNYTGFRQSPVIKGDYDPKMTVGVLRED